ncbi:MAG: DUF6599 family protein [Terriglobales bacterium]
MKLLRFLILSAVAGISAFALASQPAAPSAKSSILPPEFAGWNLTGTMQSSKDPAVADPVNAAVLKEYGFTDFNSAVYTRDDGRKLTVKAARFQDASGAYGAFTYYKVPQMQHEQIGDQGASFNERVLFYRGDIVIDAQFQKLSAMSAAESRDLSAELPPPPSNAAGLPGLPAYLPTKNYLKNTAKYIVGPAALEKLSAPLSAQLVDFNAGAEVVLGDYGTGDGQARVTLISYPTPQIAMSHLSAIDSAKQQTAQGPPALDPASTFDKRTGPIIVVVSGLISAGDAKPLLNSVNYEADVTWNKNTYFSRRDDPGNLLVNVIYLCAIIGGFAVVSGVAFGGIRILAKRFFPDKLFDRPDMGLISLHLSGDGPPSASRDVS